MLHHVPEARPRPMSNRPQPRPGFGYVAPGPHGPAHGYCRKLTRMWHDVPDARPRPTSKLLHPRPKSWFRARTCEGAQQSQRCAQRADDSGATSENRQSCASTVQEVRRSSDAATDVDEDDEVNDRMSDCSATTRASNCSLDAVRQNIVSAPDGDDALTLRQQGQQLESS